MRIFEQSRTFPAQIESLPPSLEFVLSCARACGLPEPLMNSVELSVEEIIVNVCDYAYPGKQGEVGIVCAGLREDSGDSFAVEISDRGIPFDVLSAPVPDISAAIQDRPIGRLGIFLVRKLMDDVRYRHENGRNIVTLVIKNAGNAACA